MKHEEIMSLEVGQSVWRGFIGGFVLEISDKPDRFGNQQRRVVLSDGDIHVKRPGLTLFCGVNASGQWQDSWWNDAVLRPNQPEAN